MFPVVRLFIAAAIAVTLGFTWTVGQGSGLAQVNKNLCELWASLPLPPYAACEFQYVLVVVWAVAAVAVFVWLTAETVGFFRRRKKIAKQDGPTDLSALSPKQLRSATISFAAKMRDFEAAENADAMTRPQSTFDPAKTREQMIEDGRRSQDAFVRRWMEKTATFSNNYIVQARELEDELIGRLRREGKLGPHGKQMERRALEGSMTGFLPIAEAANYLERLARKLSA